MDYIEGNEYVEYSLRFILLHNTKAAVNSYFPKILRKSQKSNIFW